MTGRSGFPACHLFGKYGSTQATFTCTPHLSINKMKELRADTTGDKISLPQNKGVQSEELRAPPRLQGSESRAIAAAVFTESLLKEMPILNSLRENDTWVVSDSKLRAIAAALGITPPQEEMFPPKDVMEVNVKDEETKVTYCHRPRFDYSSNEALEYNLDVFLGDTVAGQFEIPAWGDLSDLSVTSKTGTIIPVSVLELVPPEGVEVAHEIVGEMRLHMAQRSNLELFRSVEDKVAQRNIAAKLVETGIMQPRYLDAREVHTTAKTIACMNPDLNSLPVDDILTTLRSSPHIFVVIDSAQGFLIVNDGISNYVHSDRQEISELCKKHGLTNGNTLSTEEFSAGLSTFLDELDRSELYTVQLLGNCKEIFKNEIIDETLIPGILGHDSTLYLKSTRTSGGQLVVCKKKNEVGENTLLSDSCELGAILADGIRNAIQLAELVRNTIPEGASIPPWIDNPNDFFSLKGVLNKILRRMKSPIVEEEIPIPRVSTELGLEKSEFRLIFQGHKTPELAASYAKSSINEVAANISYGGRGRAIRDVLSDIYSQFSRLSPLEIQQSLELSHQDLLNAARKFATTFSQQYKAAGGFHDMRDFAVDLCPVWNDQNQSIDFYLLEVQCLYGFSGLMQVSPEDADKVQAFKDRLGENEHLEGSSSYIAAPYLGHIALKALTNLVDGGELEHPGQKELVGIFLNAILGRGDKSP